MVLVCHEHRFIFLKTRKTASTSVEMFFEPYCRDVAPEEVTISVPETVEPKGIVGAREACRRTATDKWYGHLAAVKVRDYLGFETWSRYFKFATVRNPFAAFLSYYFFCQDEPYARDDAEFERHRKSFRRFARNLQKQHGFGDRTIVFVDGRYALDGLIRYECLSDDVAEICHKLDLTFEREHLPQTRVNQGMDSPYPVRDYYDTKSREIVEKSYDWAFSAVGYNREPPASPPSASTG